MTPHFSCSANCTCRARKLSCGTADPSLAALAQDHSLLSFRAGCPRSARRGNCSCSFDDLERGDCIARVHWRWRAITQRAHDADVEVPVVPAFGWNSAHVVANTKQPEVPGRLDAPIQRVGSLASRQLLLLHVDALL